MANAVIDINELLDIDPRTGEVLVREARLPVQQIIALHSEGMEPQAIADGFTGVSLAAIYASLAYYHEHRDEMDREAKEDHLAALARAKGLGAEIL